jgi:RHS repeat-associated protein
VHPDHLGSTNVVTDENGNVVQTLDYYPYGATRVSVGTSTNEKRQFIGQFADDSTLSYLQARYYDPSRGQFISQDPVFWSQEQNLRDPQSLNSYSYAQDNPITSKDPDGKQTAPLDAAALGAIAASLIRIAAALTAIGAAGSIAISPQTQQSLTQLSGSLNQLSKTIAASSIGLVTSMAPLSPAAQINMMPSTGVVGGTAVTTPYSIGIVLPLIQSPGISGINLATNGKTTINEKPGATIDDLQKDFNALNPTAVKEYPGGVKVGKLPNGDTVVARPTSTDGRQHLKFSVTAFRWRKRGMGLKATNG